MVWVLSHSEWLENVVAPAALIVVFPESSLEGNG